MWRYDVNCISMPEVYLQISCHHITTKESSSIIDNWGIVSYITKELHKTATERLSFTRRHRQENESWVPVNQNHKVGVSPLWMALLPLHNQTILSPKPTWLRQSLWMKDAVKANVLLCFIGYSESFWKRILKIKPSKAFLILAAHQDLRQLQPILGFVKQTEVTVHSRRLPTMDASR